MERRRRGSTSGRTVEQLVAFFNGASTEVRESIAAFCQALLKAGVPFELPPELLDPEFDADDCGM
jgi:hypothetical protein